MAIKAVNQIDVIDLTDGYSVVLTLGTIKWYKDGGTTAVATGTTYTIGAGDISNKATFSAQLEG